MAIRYFLDAHFLCRYFPGGIDIYFDHGEAEMLEAVVANMNNYGRIAAFGVISKHTDSSNRVAPDILEIVLDSITAICGFLMPIS